MISRAYRIVILIILSISLIACSSKSDVKDSQGHTINMHNYLGKWVIVNYWASWCKPCLTEMPVLNNLQKEHSDKVVVLGVNFDKMSNSQIQAVSKKLAIDYPLLSNFPIQKYGTTNIDVLPITYIFNPKGKLVKILKGPKTQEEFITAIGFRS